MRRIRIRLPAAATGLGVALSGVSLAVNLYTQVEITERTDDQLIVDTSGEDAGHYALGLRHPVVIGMARIFQHLEQTTPGLTIRIDSQVPVSAGLGVETAFALAGMIGANNLFGNPLPRAQIMAIASEHSPAEQVAAILMGGLMSCIAIQDGQVASVDSATKHSLLMRPLPAAALSMVLMLPGGVAGRPHFPERVRLADALHNLRLLPLQLEALRSGDHALLRSVMDDRLYTPEQRQRLPVHDDIVDFARRWGAGAVSFVGDGRGLMFFAERDADKLREALIAYCDDEAIDARFWTLGIDTQGIVVSMAQSS